MLANGLGPDETVESWDFDPDVELASIDTGDDPPDEHNWIEDQEPPYWATRAERGKGWR